MDAHEWQDCRDPDKMFQFVRRKVSDRRLRLFASACCRRVWHILEGDISRKAVETAERYADGLATNEELALAWKTARQERAQLQEWAEEAQGNDPYAPVAAAGAAAEAAAEEPHGWSSARLAFMAEASDRVKFSPWSAEEEADTRRTVNERDAEQWEAYWQAEEKERACQADLFRDILGSPPFRVVRVSPSWLAWNGATVETLARAIYDDRDFERLPILADALEEAGCNDQSILDHLRGPGPHARGCNVLDAILGNSDLMAEVGRFKAWANAYPTEDRSGEWECDYQHWNTIYHAVLCLVIACPFSDWSAQESQAILYAIARDNENQHLVREIRQSRPETLVALARAAVSMGERDNKWQLAEGLGQLGRRGGEEERLLLTLARDEYEYVRRRSLGALLRLGSPAVEGLALEAWHRPDEAQEWARMMALECLCKIGSPHLEPLLAEAEQDPRPYLSGYAKRIRAGEIAS